MYALPPFPTIADFQAPLRSGSATLPELVEAVLARIETRAPAEVFITRVDPALVRRRAAQWHDRLLAAPDLPARMPLLGVPFAVKDNIDAAGLATTCACPAFARVARRSATVVERLEAAGAILVGKTNLDQFATGLVGTRSPYGEVRNPFHPDYVSGGSSSGSAAAVAHGLVPFALGTDTAGSGRVPAAFCNLVGSKPTPGLVSTHGVFPACRSLDCVCAFSHTVADGWRILSTLTGVDPADAYSRHVPALAPLARTVRFGVPAPLDFLGDALAEHAFADALNALRRQSGFEFVDVPFEPFLDVARLLYEGPWIAERRLALGRFFDDHHDDLDPTVRAVIAQADGKSALDAFDALYRLEAGKRMAESVFERIDVLVVPSAPTMHRRATVATDPIARNSDLGRYTNFVNLLGLCAVALPGPFRRDGLPAGVTLIAPGGGDHRLAELGRRLEPLLHSRLGLGVAPPPRQSAALDPLPEAAPMARIAVVGAHLSGMALNGQLIERQARLQRAARTAPAYRLFALAATDPPKPGLLRVADGGCAVELEIWEMPLSQYGAFVASIPAPLGIGTLELEDGDTVQGFLCEAAATAGARDITHYGGWRAYCAAARP